MREKDRVIQGEEKEQWRRRELIYVGLNWIMIFLIGEKHQWQAEYKDTACLSKVKSRGAGWYLYLFPLPLRKVNSCMSQTPQTVQTEAYPIED